MRARVKLLMCLAVLVESMAAVCNVSAAPRRTLVESFVNSGSSASSESQRSLRGQLAARVASEDVVVVDYHVAWPAADPLYEASATDIEGRRMLFGVDYVPTTRINGLQFRDAHQFSTYEDFAQSVDGTINGLKSVESHVELRLTPALSGDLCVIDVEIAADAGFEPKFAEAALSPRLFVALLGDRGSGGNEFLGFLSGPGGDQIIIEAGEESRRSLMFSKREVSLRTGGVPIVAIAAWVQEPTGFVHNARRVSLGRAEVEGRSGAMLALSSGLFRPQAGGVAISFGLDQPSQAELVIYDVVGRKVVELVSGQMTAGVHEVTWGGVMASGQSAPAGLYLVRLQVGRQSRSQKLLLLR